MARKKTSELPSYDSYREQQAEISRERSAEGREIGPIPPIKNPRRRKRGLSDPEYFHRTYFPGRYTLRFGQPHKQMIRTLAGCTESGGLYAVAVSRGFGKTTITSAEVIRALLYGLRRYVVFIAATDHKATQAVKTIFKELRSNELLYEDFPEVCYPIRKLERINQRASGQTCGGEPTAMQITDSLVILPTIKGSKASGGVVEGYGLTGALKGANVLTEKGETIRPDMVVIDDAQTRESAKSPTQTDDRERIITDDVLGLAGPTTRIAAVFLCTPIYPNDLTERFLNHERHPDWSGVRTAMVEQMPVNLTEWDKYGEVLRQGLRDRDGGRAANRYYKDNREVLDSGCVLSWPDRVKDGDVSAVQSAMNLYLLNPIGFASEYQCQPQSTKLAEGAKEYSVIELTQRFSGLDRGIVPLNATRLTAFIDVGGELLWWAVVAWNERFGGHVVDYGCYPEQTRSVFAASDPRPGLSDMFPAMTERERVFAGLERLGPHVFGRMYPKQGGGAVKIERALIDAGWVPDVVSQYLLRSGLPSVYPSKGVGRSATQVGVARWKPRPGERQGHHWRLTITTDQRRQLLQFDPDAWKTFIHAGFSTPMGGDTALTLFGKSGNVHELFAEHIAAEYGEPKELHGDRFLKWSMMPNRTDNHLLDCLVGAAVAASFAGLDISLTAAPKPPAKPRKSYSELQAKREQERLQAKREQERLQLGR